MAAGVSSFVMVRAGSTTHTVNTDQRRVPLVATPTPIGLPNLKTYRLVIPSDAGVVIPGDYLVFALGPTGTPSVALPVTFKV